MTIQELKKHTNVYGCNYIEMYYKDVEILGATDKGARKNEFFVIYKRGNYYGVFVLPTFPSVNDSCCLFGDIAYYSLFLQSKHPKNKGINNSYLFDMDVEIETNKMLMDLYNIPKSAL